MLLNRRLVAALRSWVFKPPTDRLVALLRRGRTHGTDYLRLCQELGLRARAEKALASAPTGSLSVAVRIRQAVLTGRIDEAVALGRALAQSAEARRTPRRELKAVVASLAPLSADTALAVIVASGRAHPGEPALLLQLGQRAAAQQRLQDRAALMGPQQWLIRANLQTDPLDKLDALNRCLAAYGLSTALLRAGSPTLAVTHLDGPLPTQPSPTGLPLLSVVMTCHDSGSHLDAALRSVLQQVHTDFELIAIDDGSQDDTWLRLQASARADARVRPVRLRHNVGTYAAKNVGLGLARGEYLAFQDADDWSHPQRFARCLAALRERPELVAVSALYVRLQDDGEFWSSKVWPLLRWTPNSVVFRRTPVTERIGAFDEHRFGADSEFMARLQQAFGARAVQRLAMPLIVAARRENSLMTAPGTGLDAQGRSQARIDYQEAWMEDLLQRALAGASLHRHAQLGTAALIAEPLGLTTKADRVEARTGTPAAGPA